MPAPSHVLVVELPNGRLEHPTTETGIVETWRRLAPVLPPGAVLSAEPHTPRPNPSKVALPDHQEASTP